MGKQEVHKIAGHMASMLGLVPHHSELESLDEGTSAVLVTVVESAMELWLQMKGTSKAFKLCVSGAREGKSESLAACCAMTGLHCRVPVFGPRWQPLACRRLPLVTFPVECHWVLPVPHTSWPS